MYRKKIIRKRRLTFKKIHLPEWKEGIQDAEQELKDIYNLMEEKVGQNAKKIR